MHEEELRDLYSSPGIKGRRPLGKPKRRWVDNINMDLEEIGWSSVDWIGLVP
jgi:hypothetical protein